MLLHFHFIFLSHIFRLFFTQSIVYYKKSQNETQSHFVIKREKRRGMKSEQKNI